MIWSQEYQMSEWLTPKMILHGQVGEKYVDLCQVAQRHNYLQIMSEKYEGGWHRFTESGIYAIYVKPIVAGRRHGREMRIRVSYQQSDWVGTHVVGAAFIRS